MNSLGSGGEGKSLADITARLTHREAAARGACKKCGYAGHLTYQCRNFVPGSKMSEAKEVFVDVSSTSSEESSPLSDSEDEKERLAKTERMKFFANDEGRPTQGNPQTSTSSRPSGRAEKSSDEESDDDGRRTRDRKKRRDAKKKKAKKSKKKRKISSSESSSSSDSSDSDYKKKRKKGKRSKKSKKKSKRKRSRRGPSSSSSSDSD